MDPDLNFSQISQIPSFDQDQTTAGPSSINLASNSYENKCTKSVLNLYLSIIVRCSNDCGFSENCAFQYITTSKI